MIDAVAASPLSPRDVARAAAPGGHAHQRVVALHHTVAEQREPQREQRVGQRSQQGQYERERHEARFVLVAELAEAPHGPEGGREPVSRRLR